MNLARRPRSVHVDDRMCQYAAFLFLSLKGRSGDPAAHLPKAPGKQTQPNVGGVELA